ncbi:polyprenyl synthetase family protein [Lactobacillus kefiranofaciens subsp. kefirgranum]|uniref:polyprenyl synthetase family protein n=1 Tax=Lactobacillus kefiranofaciens TaxID=267818 RepID=UPI0006EF0AB0|nr:polyprenyl synthetase family protein [Lactobacillus kefiranofaciens]KRL23719.1 trans-hexaprenyltranstransferase [Lactobacillus kefiranofaciens subsp. kefirgranum DSM 10550 = JCM 8572]MCJ2172792.1 polyprenyl synthetase family protein [Lactobacillus kefiranofaciens]QNT44633.1 polyprenyl synthetase family protein [Lactobacillus kefiranofaciens]URW71545.1 polyprenyl synthetase family protein [Lactobacillus kefiranofaciens subsp. kefirgranum]URW73492.1 polyprenyl synthetase family protein [Lacto
MNNSKPWKKYPLIDTELQAVNELIQQTIKTPHPSLQSALLTMADNGGKYLRPSLLLLAARAVGKVDEQTIKLGASIEILHMATLIHDDIIDDSDKRRGAVSIQAAFGKDVAVYTGDLLFTDFFDLMLGAINEHDYFVRNAQTMRQILNGELGQMGQRFNLKQTLNSYISDVRGKTAALFRLAAEEGAHFAGGNHAQTMALANFAENLGIAFQIVDDLLDYNGGAQMNKPTLEDLATGVYSLPLLLALDKPNLKQQLLPLLNKKRQMTLTNMQAVQRIIVNSSVISESQDLAKQYVHQAVDCLNILKPNPAVRLLKQLPNKLLTRNF